MSYGFALVVWLSMQRLQVQRAGAHLGNMAGCDARPRGAIPNDLVNELQEGELAQEVLSASS